MAISTVSLDMIQGSLFKREFTFQTFNGTEWVPEDISEDTFTFKVLDCEGVDGVVLVTGQSSPDGELVAGPTQGVLQVKILAPSTLGLESSTWSLWRNAGTPEAYQEAGGNIDYHKVLQP